MIFSLVDFAYLTSQSPQSYTQKRINLDYHSLCCDVRNGTDICTGAGKKNMDSSEVTRGSRCSVYRETALQFSLPAHSPSFQLLLLYPHDDSLYREITSLALSRLVTGCWHAFGHPPYLAYDSPGRQERSACCSTLYPSGRSVAPYIDQYYGHCFD